MAAYVLIGVGLALALVPWVELQIRGMNSGMFTEAVIKLVKADNLDRGLKLCRAIPRAVYARAVGAILEQAQELGDLRQPGARQKLEDNFHLHFDEGIKHLRRFEWLGSLGVLVAVAGAAMSVTGDTFEIYPPIGALAALAVTFGARRMVSQTRAAGRAGAEQVIETLVGR